MLYLLNGWDSNPRNYSIFHSTSIATVCLQPLGHRLVFDSFHGLKLTNLLGKLMGLGPKPSAIWQLFYLCFAKSISTNGYSL